MKPKHFLQKLDDTQITAAIAEAEHHTSGRIHVFISHRRLGRDDIMYRARRRFEKLCEVSATTKNHVLLYVIPRDCKFAVLGGPALHEKCEGECWNALVKDLQTHFQQDRFIEGILHAIHSLGTILSRHFPKN